LTENDLEIARLVLERVISALEEKPVEWHTEINLDEIICHMNFTTIPRKVFFRLDNIMLGFRIEALVPYIVSEIKKTREHCTHHG